MAKKYLITSALPYVNGELHLGHLIGCYLPSDVYARFCRARGRDVLFVCGADEHGTPAVVGAAAEGLPIIEYNNKYYEKHLRAVRDFNLSFDLYGRTHTEKQEKLIHELFKRLDEQGLIEERETIQPFSVDDDMFLADRQLVGTCPKCGYENARGDQCDKCSATYEATELINPRSAISGSDRIEARATKNLFFLASKIEDKWKEWLSTHAPKWSKSAAAIARGWANEGLRDTSITRDLPWGIPVNKPGYENKVFYVWFDAPWGYVSISQYANEDWASWWKNPDAHYAQFMGKDNVKFHSVFFPEQQLAMNDNWKTVDMLKGMNFLNFEGGKFSKSQKRGIFLDSAILEAPADTWRYALLASAPETDDTDFTIARFADIVNKDLNGMLGNFVSRVCKLTAKNFGNNVPNAGAMDSDLESQINEKLSELTAALDGCEFRAAIAALRGLYAIGNEYMTAREPWALVKNGDMDAAGAVLNECFQLIDLYARVSAPFIPTAAEKMQNVFTTTHDLSWPEKYEHRVADGAEFVVPENLFNRIDDETVVRLTEKYAPKKEDNTPKPVVAKVLSVENHPTRDDLHILSVDFGGNAPAQVVCGAPNVRAGMIGVLAPVGAQLPTMKKPITQRTVAGTESFGMMCSAVELGIGDDDKNIIELSYDAVVGDIFTK
ncbi:MAG: methionine--tRNA ligase [Alphaproteobacteria bacterium]|nr:methionine--tRNA ligase [Alphaproteobacteria bacterium]